MSQSLLKIDVTREIRKLTRNRFKTSTEWAVSLCRYAMGQRCTSLQIQLESKQLTLRFQGTPIDSEDLHRLCVIFDHRQPIEARHRSIVKLEAGDSFELLSAFYLKNPKVVIEAAPAKLHIAPRKQPTLNTHFSGADTVIRVTSGQLKQRAVGEALQKACRYCATPVTLNGASISSGHRLTHCFAQRTFEWHGVKGVVGIPLESDFVRQVTLNNGITQKDTLKQPAFGLLYHAIIDSTIDDAKLDDLRNVVRAMYIKLGAKIEDFNLKQRRRALEVLFIRYQETQDIRYVEGVRAFERVDGHRFSYEMLQKMSRRMPLYGILQSSPPAPWNLVGRQTFYLDVRQWNFLEKELGVSICAPPLLNTGLGRRINRRITLQTSGKNSGVKNPKDQKPFSKETRLAAERLRAPF